MSRVPSTYQTLKRQSRKALVTFVVAGDPEPADTPGIMHALVRHGADLLELGMPFSNPVADGPVIRRANARALAKGVTLVQVLEMVAQFRRTDTRTPVLLMGYANPVKVFGYQAFAAQAAAAGVDGVIIADMPPEAAALFNRELRTRDIDQVFLVTPVTSARRIDVITGMTSGFLYYVSVRGKTGGKQPDVREVAGKLRMLRGKTKLPLAVGFGIRNAETVEQLARHSDAVVVGSALVERIHNATQAGEDIDRGTGAFIAPLRAALDKAA